MLFLSNEIVPLSFVSALYFHNHGFALTDAATDGSQAPPFAAALQGVDDGHQ
jgi:hypothetical protein